MEIDLEFSPPDHRNKNNRPRGRKRRARNPCHRRATHELRRHDKSPNLRRQGLETFCNLSLTDWNHYARARAHGLIASDLRLLAAFDGL